MENTAEIARINGAKRCLCSQKRGMRGFCDEAAKGSSVQERDCQRWVIGSRETGW